MHTEFIEKLASAISSHSPLPEFNDELSLDEAYDYQHAVTAIRSPGGVGGLKAGVTSKLAQGFFKLEHALIGSLYADARRSTGCSIPFLKGRTIECELAVIVDANGHPERIAPAIEIVYVNFGRQTDMSAANLVTCNLGADIFIVGDFVPWNTAFNDITVELERDGEVVSKANATEALDGPELAVPWMWREASKRGFNPSGETLFMTGACGTVVPGELGCYVANFGALGRIEFEIAPTQ